MATILPPIPRFVLTIFEPISLIAGAVAPFIDSEWFIAEQIPRSVLEPVSENARMVACQLGNIYLLMALVGIAVLQTTTESKVVRNYVIALWLADITHVGVTSYLMGYAKLFDVGSWNAMAWGNIGATVALFSVRTAYLLGLFGPDLQPTKLSKKRL